jgi:hypothetical protein
MFLKYYLIIVVALVHSSAAFAMDPGSAKNVGDCENSASAHSFLPEMDTHRIPTPHETEHKSSAEPKFEISERNLLDVEGPDDKFSFRNCNNEISADKLKATLLSWNESENATKESQTIVNGLLGSQVKSYTETKEGPFEQSLFIICDKEKNIIAVGDISAGGRIFGIDFSNYSFLNNVIINPDNQGQGAGKAAIRFVIMGSIYFADKGVGLMSISRDADKFFEKLGFERVGYTAFFKLEEKQIRAKFPAFEKFYAH